MQPYHCPQVETKSSATVTAATRAKPILCSQTDAGKMLAIGKTKLSELVTQGKLETIRIGSRRLVKISSIRRLAGVDPDGGEAQ